MMEDQAYGRKMNAMLGEWPERIDLMENRTSAIPEARRATYQELVRMLRARYADAVRALGDFNAAPAAGLADARRKLERAWAELAGVYEQSLCQFEGVKN